MSDEPIGPESPYSFITIRLDYSEGWPEPIIDLGDVDPWAAMTIFQACVEHCYDMRPEPRFVDEEVEVDGD